MLQEPVIPQYRVAMTVPRLGDLPEPVLELLVMCLVDAAYDCEHAAKSFRAHFDGNAAAEEFTADAVRSIVREMAHEGMLQFFHAACTPEKQCFEPPPRKANIPQGRVPEFEEVNPTPADFQDRTCILTDSVLVNVFENLGRSDRRFSWRKDTAAIAPRSFANVS
eukprot:symbB.v1.2.010251.t1/scaffold670.1/size174347/2